MYCTLLIVLSTLAIGCLSLPVLLQQEEIQRSISRSSPGVVGAGVAAAAAGVGGSISSTSTTTHLGGAIGERRPLGGEIVETRRTTSTSTREVLGKLQEAPAGNNEEASGQLKEEQKSGAYVVGTGVIGTPVVVATPLVHTGLLHRSYPHVGVGIGRVDVTRTETNVVTSGVY